MPDLYSIPAQYALSGDTRRAEHVKVNPALFPLLAQAAKLKPLFSDEDGIPFAVDAFDSRGKHLGREVVDLEGRGVTPGVADVQVFFDPIREMLSVVYLYPYEPPAIEQTKIIACLPRRGADHLAALVIIDVAGGGVDSYMPHCTPRSFGKGANEDFLCVVPSASWLTSSGRQIRTHANAWAETFAASGSKVVRASMRTAARRCPVCWEPAEASFSGHLSRSGALTVDPEGGLVACTRCMSAPAAPGLLVAVNMAQMGAVKGTRTEHCTEDMA